MRRNLILLGTAFFALSTTANATLLTLLNPMMQQTGPAATPGQRFANVTDSATWTWDDVTGTITQNGQTSFTFGPALPASVAYTLNFTDMQITGAGVTTVGAYTCTDGNFAATLAATICGGYSFFGGGPTPNANFTNDSTIINNATTCSRTIMGNDNASAPPICISNAFNNGTDFGSPGTNAMSVRDTTVADLLKVRPENFVLTAPYGAAGSGWEFQFTVGAPVPIPAAGWLLGSALLGVAGFARRRISRAADEQH